MADGSFKRGTTFALPLHFKDGEYSDGTFSGFTLHSQARNDDGWSATLSASWDDNDTQSLTVEGPQDTSDWPLGDIKVDVLMIAPNGDRGYTQTLTLEVTERVTNG